MYKMKTIHGGIIYGIRCKTTGGLYIGSTIEPLETRLAKHLTDLRGFLGINKCYRHYRSSFEVLMNDNYEIFQIEEFKCDNKRDLEIRETLHIINNDCVNVKKPIKINVNDYDLSELPSVC